ncbi:serine/threonine-protein phosphatase 7 long form-like protein, partial [Trifolium medium]|nr:serine/threonine-protein phosphatase 7 long form-like protein [Trifolium medium]
EEWFRDRLAVTGLADLAKTEYQHLDPCLISAFAERWHEETSSFHMPAGEIIVTLDYMSCLLHLPLGGHLLDHTSLTKAEGITLMVDLLGSDAFDAHTEV